MAKQRECPKCDARDVVRLPDNGISPFPGFRCNGCGAKLRAPGTGTMYAAVLVLSLTLAALFAYPWFDPQADRLPIGLPIAGAGLAVYCALQLARPTSRVRDGDPPP